MRPVKRIINDMLDQQEQKGIETYGTTLEEASHSDYDWNQMALEEAIDMCQYLAKENRRLRSVEHLKMKKGLPSVISYDGRRYVYDPNN
ncbi:hypothetical protein [Salimicrobium halophilum]|uniref:Uncharacterized protein n=1 Tax=Salimicrobium halophilum TaxID=86666 RepID=A0A1G8WEM4_9BACI|nr:hypothetical protein [Salimicrobium halophilum]SDJ76728.1 hypothetical protein SAMN04490247_3158 [Salimicrobium halophilum]